MHKNKIFSDNTLVDLFTYVKLLNKSVEVIVFPINTTKHFLAFKASWGRLQDMSWRRPQHVFSVTIFRLPRRLEDISQDVLKTSWKTKNCYAENVLKTCLEEFLKTSSRRLGDKQNVNWGYLYLANLNVYLTNLYLTSLYLANPRRIENALIRTQ